MKWNFIRISLVFKNVNAKTDGLIRKALEVLRCQRLEFSLNGIKKRVGNDGMVRGGREQIEEENEDL